MDLKIALLTACIFLAGCVVEREVVVEVPPEKPVAPDMRTDWGYNPKNERDKWNPQPHKFFFEGHRYIYFKFPGASPRSGTAGIVLDPRCPLCELQAKKMAEKDDQNKTEKP